MMSRLIQIISLGRITLTDESGPIAEVQVDQGSIGPDSPRIVDRIKRFGQFGLASVPPLPSEVLMVALGGLRSQLIAIATNHQASRPRGLKPGDTRLYDVRGAMIDMTADGLVIDAAGLPVVVRNFSLMTVEGDLHVTGDVVSRQGQISLNALRDAYDGHHHSLVKAGVDRSGPTDQPA